MADENNSVDGKYQFAQGIKSRFHDQRQTLEKGEKDYFYTRGDYGDDLNYIFPADSWELYGQPNLERESTVGLIGTELYLRNLIREMLEKQSKHPVVVLDIGGMVGLSWARLANHFQKQIANNQLAFVVSNLTYIPNFKDKNLGLKYEDILTEDEKEFLVQTGSLVHYVNSDISLLRRQKINLPNGQTIPLQGNIDLAYETRSITAWSNVPDLDILRIPGLLSPQGMYFVHELDTLELQGEMSLREEKVRIQAISNAHRALVERYGLKMITETEDSIKRPLNYIVFRRELAPKIKS